MKRLDKDLSILVTSFVVWRTALFLVAYSAPNFISSFGAKFPYYNERLVASGLPGFIWSFGNFDGVHYLGIAKDGYAYQFTQAFFPLYPLLIRLVSSITSLDLLLSALILSNTTFCVGLLIFYKLIARTYDKKIALWSTMFIFAFPTSYYFGAVYTEGLFFMLIMLSLYLFERKRLVLASIFGLGASATRLVGIFITVSILNYKKIKLIPLALVPLGLLGYMLFLKFKFNNAFYFLTSQGAFGQERSTTEVILLPQVIFRSIKQILTTNGIVLFNSTLDLFALSFCLIMLAIAYKKTKKEWVIFSFLAVLTPTLTGSLASMPRYILIAFPMYIVLAQINSAFIKILILLSSIALGLILASLYTRGYWIA